MSEKLYRMVQIILTPVAILFSLIAMLGIGTLQKQRGREEVKRLLEEFVDQTVDKEEWSNFTLFRLNDPQLEAIRQKANRISVPPNSEDLDAARSLLSELARTP